MLAFGAVSAQGASESLVTDDSPVTPFPQNKQNEPTVAIDPTNPSVAVAGSNDEIDLAPCDGSDCPFTPGVGVSGVYFSFDGGNSWDQPTYQGYSARDGSPGPGPIGTLPKYYEHGLVSDGDPVTAFGPTPDGNGGFTFGNGSRLYYANLTANFNTKRSDFTFKGQEAIAVSHTDNPVAAAANAESAWSAPKIVTTQRQSSSTFSDKEDIGVDNAESSPYFGNAYVCYSRFQSYGGEPDTISVSRSTDGGHHWTKPLRLTASYNSPGAGGRQGCQVAADSEGTVYVVWEDSVHHQSVFLMSRSFDGGLTFEKKPRIVAQVTDVGKFDGVRSISFDGVAGARTSSFPSLDIANGAPSGAGAPDTLALGWSDGQINDEHALVQLSSNKGRDWTDPRRMEEAGDRPDFAFLGISPDGEDLYVEYDGFLDPFRETTDTPRRFQGVLRHADLGGAGGTTISNRETLDRGAVGDARASSANALIDEFLGDYNTVAATNDGAISVFNDARDAAVCPAINEYRQSLVTSGAASGVGPEDGDLYAGDPDAPAPATDCPPTFGNTDIWSASTADPTP